MRKNEAVEAYIKERIKCGTLPTGTRLPSVRTIARELHCSVGTVLSAYEALEQDKLVYSVPKSGYYVLDSSLLHSLSPAAPLIDFATTALDSRIIPYSDIQSCINCAIDLYRENLFAYSDIKGLPSLIQALKKYLIDCQVFTGEENIIVTTGSQMALHILCEMPLPTGRSKILIEQPTYYGMVKAAELTHTPCVGIERTADGLDFNRLEQIFREEKIKFFYIIPRFHNPTGGSLSRMDMERLVCLAEKYHVYLVEDDIAGDLALDNRSAPLFYYDTHERTIYIKSFSKMVMPGLRIAAVVLPQGLVSDFLLHKEYIDMTSPILSQGALEIYLKNGMFQHHKNKLRTIYAARMKCLDEVVASCRTSREIDWPIPKSGFFSCLRCRRHIHYPLLAAELFKQQIRITDANKYFLPEFQDYRHLRVSVSKVSESEIRRGVPILLSVIDSLFQ